MTPAHVFPVIMIPVRRLDIAATDIGSGEGLDLASDAETWVRPTF